MKRAGTVKEVYRHLTALSQKPSGFVPTMGALHKGHLALVKMAIAECPVVSVSIFVNPNQFNDKEDLRNYPRTIESDLSMLGSVLRENDLVFIPSVSEIYPEEDTRIFSFGNLENVMEGKFRPGHFNGVAQVVSRLFDIINPDIAFFGQKDFQQLTVIKELVKQEDYKIIIRACPIIRDADGLAMSSRNKLLSNDTRKDAGIIYKALSVVSEGLRHQEVELIKEQVGNMIESVKGFSIEYFEIVDDVELKPVSRRSDFTPGRKYFGCIAVRAGSVRLIDNIEIQLL